ncbi:MAG: sortase, partial [Candidatus Curtissbacteria bacterium]|nr:sortase [Candidatus Curtissbacteria bacterium]
EEKEKRIQSARTIDATQTSSPESSQPTYITIPSVSINLPVSPGQIVDNQWTLYDTRVSWLSTSQTPGKGNVILYGHNRVNILANLEKVTIGSEISVKTKEKKYTYIISEKRKVTPEDIDAILSPKDQLTIYTCNGNFDEKRLVVIAYPKV